ncbi:DUF2164 domain-containing protein [Chitinibacter sp. S2-10]|uniref:DUF2164 domain-containing protein n=1 Tax=Chitinibacter sp. S2-10 TaxID=3373597 RepID=UPI0039776E15
MTIKLNKELESLLIAGLQNYLDREMDVESSQLQCQLLLDFIKRGIGAHIYNQAVADVQQYLHQQTDDLNLHCFVIADD